MDRVNMSVAAIPMAEALGWSRTTQGLALSSFFWGYMLTQVPGGWLADRYGGKLVLGTGVVLWSLFTLLTPVAASVSFGLLIAARIGLGMAEGVNFPSIYSLFGRWVLPHERARAGSLNTSASSLGTMLALLMTPIIVVRWGWPMAFYAYAALGLVWFAVWQRSVTSRPEDHPGITAEELRKLGSSERSDAPPLLPMRRLLASAPVWAIIVSHLCSNYGGYVMLAWLPTYVNQELGIELSRVGFYAVLPYLTAFVSVNAGGWIADGLIRQGHSVTRVRKGMQTVGFAGPALFLMLVGGVESAPQAMLYISLATGLSMFGYAAFGVNHLDIGPRHAGVLMGFSNTAGTLPGIVGVALTGFILDSSGSWGLVFGIAAGFYLFGLFFYLLFGTGERIFD